MKPRVKIGSATTPDGSLLELFEHDGHHDIFVAGQPLMGSRMHFSEEELARLACVNLPPKPVVLIGGLGVGWTLRTTLDLLPPDGRVLQVELMPEVLEWNRGPLGHHAGNPLDDPRVEVVLSDVNEVIAAHDGDLAAVMLDVDNGPIPLVEGRNARLYTNRGLRTLRKALLPGGSAAIWSASDEPGFPDRLRENGFESAVNHVVHARPRRKGARYHVFTGRRPLAHRRPRS